MSRYRHHILLAILAFLLPAAVVAQANGGSYVRPSAEVRRAAGSITEDFLRFGVFTIAHDSMLGRDTPSRGLDLTAAFIGEEFRKAGLTPGGDNGGWLQRYPLFRHRTLVSESVVRFTSTDGLALVFPLTTSAWLRFGGAPAGPVTGPVVLIGGGADTTVLGNAPLSGAVVVWAAEMAIEAFPAGLQAMSRTAARAGARALVLVSNRTDPAPFARGVAAQARGSIALDSVRTATGGLAMIEIPESAFAAQLPEAAAQLAGMRAATTTVIQPMPEWQGSLDIRAAPVERTSAPNTVGILPGSDPVLRNEYIVWSAHMDHVGSGGAAPDSIFNGADDDASGTIGVLALARAFAQPGARPKRSMIFVTVSGEEKGLWGSAWFANHLPVPTEQVVANINLDMIGRNWADTVVVIGKEHSDMGATLHAVAAAHPELRMHPIDDLWPEQRFYFRSDHVNFARVGIPILFFFTGVHEDYHRVTDTADKLGYEKMTRILKLSFYLGTELGNRAARPQWNPDSYRQIVQPRTP